MTTKLYVGNLSWNTTREDLAELFGRFGNVEDAFIPTERETGRSRGFGFVTMAAAEASNAASQLNETDFQGRSIRVNEAQPQGERGGGGYGGGRGGGYGGRGGGGYGGGGYGGRGGGGYGGGGYNGGGGGYGGGGGGYNGGGGGGYSGGGGQWGGGGY